MPSHPLLRPLPVFSALVNCQRMSPAIIQPYPRIDRRQRPMIAIMLMLDPRIYPKPEQPQPPDLRPNHVYDAPVFALEFHCELGVQPERTSQFLQEEAINQRNCLSGGGARFG
jgi:hypothetical protein